MTDLPLCTIAHTLPEDIDSVYARDNNEEYQMLNQILKGYISADCRALIIDGEVIFNSYANRTIKERLIEDGMRRMITENPHRAILCHINRAERPAIIEIYMFGGESHKLVISYDPVNKTYSTRQFVSEQFLARLASG